MAEHDVTAPDPPPAGRDHRPPRRRLPGFVIFGIVAATIEMAIVLWILFG